MDASPSGISSRGTESADLREDLEDEGDEEMEEVDGSRETACAPLLLESGRDLDGQAEDARGTDSNLDWATESFVMGALRLLEQQHLEAP